MCPPSDDKKFDDDDFELDDDLLDQDFDDDLDDDLSFENRSETDDFAVSDDDSIMEEDEEALGWGDEEESADSSLIKDKSDSFLSKLSFNTIVISGAVVVGFIILLVQVMGSQPEEAKDVYISSVRMQGASDGEIFGDKEDNDLSVDVAASDQEKAILFNPQLLDSMKEEPVPNNQQEELSETTFVDRDADPQIIAQENKVKQQVPRRPDNMPSGTTAVKEEEAAPKKSQQSGFDFLANMTAPKEDSTSDVVMESPQAVQAAPKGTIQNSDSDQRSFSAEQMTQNREQVVRLEGKVQSLEEELITLEQDKQSVIDDLTRTIESLQNQLKAQKKAMAVAMEQKAAAESRAEKQIVKQTKKQAAAAQKTIQKTAPKSWELRAAQPGKAWLARKGTNDMRAIVIGDTLDGLGRITDISYQNNRWIVKGESGIIRQ